MKSRLGGAAEKRTSREGGREADRNGERRNGERVAAWRAVQPGSGTREPGSGAVRGRGAVPGVRFCRNPAPGGGRRRREEGGGGAC